MNNLRLLHRCKSVVDMVKIMREHMRQSSANMIIANDLHKTCKNV